MRMRKRKKQQSSNSQINVQPQLQSRPFVTQSPTNQTTDLPTLQNKTQQPGINFADIPLFAPDQRANGIPIQPKLTIGQPNDKYEQEADAVAHQVVNQINAPQAKAVQREATEEEDKVQTKLASNSGSSSVNRLMLKGNSEEIQSQGISGSQGFHNPFVQRFSEVVTGKASSNFESSLNQAKGTGQTLANSVRQPMEGAFGADFSQVKVHTDTKSDQLNKSIQAKAFTTGKDIFFRQGAYSPSTRGGQELIAHELTHVVQQNKSSTVPVQKKPTDQQEVATNQSETDLSSPTTQQPDSLVQHQCNPSDVQRAIGLEIEVAVPIDQLPATEIANIQDWTADEFQNKDITPPLDRSDPKTYYPAMQQWMGEMEDNHKKDYLGLADETLEHVRDPSTQEVTEKRKGRMFEKIDYSRARSFGGVTVGAIASGAHYSAQVDHDDRVNSGKKPPSHPWRDADNSAIIEIVTKPANDKAEFDAAMDEVGTFVDGVNTSTNNLTTHAQNPFGTGYNIGPFDYPNIGKFSNLPKESCHNWQGSMQVNIGIDLREYSGLADWYRQSDFANPQLADDDLQEQYTKAQNNIARAVEIGDEIIDELKQTNTIRNKQVGDAESGDELRGAEAFGNLEGLRGWITHLALHMLGGAEFKINKAGGSSTKNITPLLMKTPNKEALDSSLTDAELTYYQNDSKRKKILAKLIEKTGRKKRKEGSLGSRVDVGDMKISSGFGTNNRVLDDSNKLLPGANLSLDKFSAATHSEKLIAGQTIDDSGAIGPKRQGNSAVESIDSPNDQRKGVVVEFRQLPGFYNGVEAWRRVGHEFLKQAEARNKRNGIDQSQSVASLTGQEWNEQDQDQV